MCDDTPNRAKNTVLKTSSLSAPSEARQKGSTYNLRDQKPPSHTYPVIHEKLKQDSLDNSDDSQEDSNSDTILVDTLLSDEETLGNKEDSRNSPRKKYRFLTKTCGVKKLGVKPKRKCKYACSGPSCGEVFGTMSLLNEHYKASHEPVECKNCGLSFNTPSTLSQHMYSHRELKYECLHCQRKFPFASDRDIHEVKHQTEFQCQNV